MCEVKRIMGTSTNSLNFPQMFDVARGRVVVIEDTKSIANRSRLLMLTNPTELYNEPEFGVGLSKYLWQYNSPNVKPLIRDKVAEQLDMYEPMCYASETEYADGLMFTGDNDSIPNPRKLEMTIGIHTKLGTTADIDLADLQQIIEKNEALLSE